MKLLAKSAVASLPHLVKDIQMPLYHYQKPEFRSGFLIQGSKS